MSYVSPSDNDRIYDLLMQQTSTLAKISQSQDDLKERLFGAGGNPGIIQHYGKEIADHGRQLGYFKGAIAVITLAWTTAVAIIAAIIKTHH
jgi:hypothetical protein